MDLALPLSRRAGLPVFQRCQVQEIPKPSLNFNKNRLRIQFIYYRECDRDVLLHRNFQQALRQHLRDGIAQKH